MPARSWTVIPDATWTPRTIVSTGLVVDDDITRFKITIYRADWDELHPDPLVSIQLWRSEDGGETWLDAGSSSTHGGELYSDEGPLWTETTWSFTLPSATHRKIKFSLTIHRTTRLRLDVETIIE